jgi:hypothetical protein
MPDESSGTVKKTDAGADEKQGDDGEVRPENSEPTKEIGGRGGPDPTRYGDWEKNGRCVDF